MYYRYSGEITGFTRSNSKVFYIGIPNWVTESNGGMMVFMNQKGQAFSTFELLISAVVALAILVLLLNIVGNLQFFGGKNPSDEAKVLIQSQISKPSELQTTRDVTFRPESSLNAKAIATASGVITADQICISPGDFADNKNFEPSPNGAIITYTGSANITTNLSVICDTGNQLQDDLTQIGDIASNWISGTQCEAVASSDNRRTGCIIVVRAK